MSIDYSDKNKWKRFISDYVIPLRDSAGTLVEYWNYLKKEIEDVEVDEMGEDLKTILLGGVDEEGNYMEDSVAKFYKEFFGVSLSVELSKYAVVAKEGATKGIKGMVREINTQIYPNVTYFIKFILDIARQTRKIANIALSRGIIDTVAGSPSGIRHEDFITNPEAVVGRVGDFYNKCAKIVSNYNDYTLFILSIRNITKKYLEEAYPQFKDKFAELQPSLGLKPLFEPDIEDRTKKAEYTIWHLPGESFGGEVRRLYEIIWNYSGTFKDLLSQYFEKIVDLKKESIEDAKIGVAGATSEVTKINELLSHPHTLLFEGQWITHFWYFSYTRIDYDLKEKPISLMQALDEISPFLFVGLINFNVSHNEFRLKPLK